VESRTHQKSTNRTGNVFTLALDDKGLGSDVAEALGVVVMLHPSAARLFAILAGALAVASGPQFVRNSVVPGDAESS
jgi:hypothetical protein